MLISSMHPCYIRKIKDHIQKRPAIPDSIPGMPDRAARLIGYEIPVGALYLNVQGAFFC